MSERTARTLTDTQNELSRASAELSSLREAARHSTVSPHALNEANAAVDLAAIAHDQAQKDHTTAEAEERATVADKKFDAAPGRLRARQAEVERLVWEFRAAADNLWAGVQLEVSEYAHIVGDLTSTVEPHTTTRFSNGPGGVRIDGHLIRAHKSEAGVEACRAVADLIALANAALGDQVRRLGSTLNGLPLSESSKREAA